LRRSTAVFVELRLALELQAGLESSTRVTRAAAKWPAKPGSPECEIAKPRPQETAPASALWLAFRKAPACRVGMQGLYARPGVVSSGEGTSQEQGENIGAR